MLFLFCIWVDFCLIDIEIVILCVSNSRVWFENTTNLPVTFEITLKSSALSSDVFQQWNNT